jgi:hypothetical protein
MRSLAVKAGLDSAIDTGTIGSLAALHALPGGMAGSPRVEPGRDDLRLASRSWGGSGGRKPGSVARLARHA